jgi:hypothetical protein
LFIEKQRTQFRYGFIEQVFEGPHLFKRTEKL